jgi:MYXO-CTERM domain-containing protein
MVARPIGTLTCLVVLAASSTAFADAIEGPPECPPGARGVSSHSGARCVAAPCATDSDCGSGMDDYQYRGWGGAVCRPYRVCSRTSSVRPGGRGAFGPNPPPPHDELHVTHSCEISAGCTGDDRPPVHTVGTLQPGPSICRDAMHCVPRSWLPPQASPPPPPQPVSPAPEGQSASQPGGAASPGATTGNEPFACSASATGTGPAGIGLALVGLAIILARRRWAR